jgi:hypothetical protein
MTGGLPRLQPTSLDEAYARARALDAPALRAPGYRLFWCLGDDEGYLDVFARSSSYAVVGRHTRCDAVLGDDPTVALRHLLIRATRLADGTLAVRVLDLRTHFGFRLDGEASQRALVATGPLAMWVGMYALVALPSETPPPSVRPPTELVDAPRLPVAAATTGTGHVSVTTLPPAPLLEDLAMSVSRSANAANAANAANSANAANANGGSMERIRHDLARVVLRRGEKAASIDLSESALESGVLVGRSERCASGLIDALNESVSRVHLLLLREQGAVYAFDLASTQGTFAGGEPVRRVKLRDSGSAELRLASREPVFLEWHPPPVFENRAP